MRHDIILPYLDWIARECAFIIDFRRRRVDMISWQLHSNFILCLRMGIFLAVIGCLCCCVPAAQQQSFAVVINAKITPKAKLPETATVKNNLNQVINEYQASGLYVAVDPTEQCLAVTQNATIKDEDLVKGDLSDNELAVGIFERVTQEQLDARDKCYIPLSKLTDDQRSAALCIAKRHNLLDANGAIPKDKRITVGLWPYWSIWVTMQQNGIGSCRRLDTSFSPPTSPAVNETPQSGSVQWWLWPQADATWGSETVTIAAGTYTVKELVSQLEKVSKGEVLADTIIEDTSVMVVAENITIRQLLWAISVVTGLQVKALPTDPYQVLLTSKTSPGEGFNPHRNEFTPKPHRDFYFTPAASLIGRNLLSTLEGGTNQPDRYWIGWRFTELPLLYRNWITDIDPGIVHGLEENPSAQLNPDHSLVIWAKAIYLSVDIQAQDGAGQGIEFSLPAF